MKEMMIFNLGEGQGVHEGNEDIQFFNGGQKREDIRQKWEIFEILGISPAPLLLLV